MPSETLENVLTRAVVRATGLSDARPREGQLALSRAITQAFSTFGQTVGQAPTGTGKSLAYLVPAMLAAAQRDERTVISTESLGLQSQIVDKDAPDVAAAVAAVAGRAPTVALLKGWSNYVCAVQIITAINELTDGKLEHSPEGLSSAATRFEAWKRRTRAPQTQLAGQRIDRNELIGLLDWGLAIHGDVQASGDRNTCPTPASEQGWAAVSLSPSECPHDSCPLFTICKPAAAKAIAAEADVIVTNHAMLAVQAATNAPVVIGNRQLGLFDHLVIDEAHALPDRVRSMGAAVISAARLSDVIHAFGKIADDPDTTEEGWEVAARLDDHLCGLAEGGEQDGQVAHSANGPGILTFQPEDTPLGDVVELLHSWLTRASRCLPDETAVFDTGALVRLRRAKSKIGKLREDLTKANIADPDEARWMEISNDPGSGRWSGHAIKVSPVDVSPALRSAVYRADVPDVYDPTLGEGRPALPPSRWLDPTEDTSPNGKPRYALSVTAVSATLAPGFPFDAGISAQTVSYPSPFAEAYAGSLLFVPRVLAADIDEIASTRYGPRHRFDTVKHVGWASRHVCELVKANGGSALIVAATVSAGKQYAADLRDALAGTGIVVRSQWDGGTTAQVVDLWRADVGSVLVGTRSLMTGVDAPGETCSLVVIDRVPRAAGNPVDDARVRSITARAQLDRWAAERMVYVSDAALLLAQAVGRLIRRTSDRGMVAVLDPRLLRSCPLKYQDSTRTMLLGATEAFPHRTADMGEALAWLAEAAGRRAAA